MKLNTKSKKVRIALTIFVAITAVGLASPLFATGLPGLVQTTKLTVGDTSQVFAIADTDYLQGGHMQVMHISDLESITPERRSVGMLVTVMDTADNTASAANATTTYRLVSNPGGPTCPASAGLTTTPSYTVTNNSLDGGDPGGTGPCAYTIYQSSGYTNWTVVVPAISSANIGQVLTTTDGTNFSWGVISSGGSGGSFSFSTGTAGSTFNITGTSGTYVFNIPLETGSEASTPGTSGLITYADWQNFNGKQNALGFTPLNPANGLDELTGGEVTTARTSLGLGTAATDDESTFFQVANNLSEIGGSTMLELADQAAARTNLGLGTIATLSSINNSNWVGAQLATTNGGTGLTSYNVGDMLYASAPNVLSTLAIGSNGQILTVASGVPTWMANLGGNFDGTRTITRSSVSSAGAVGGTTLSDFINNFFFPAVAGSASLTGGSVREVGSTTAVTLSYSATRQTYPITAITIAGPSSSTVTGCTSGGSCTPGADTQSNAYTISIVPGSTINSSGTTGGNQTATRAATATANTNGSSTTFSLTVTPSSGSAINSTTAVSYTNRVYYGVSTNDYMDSAGAFPDGSTLYGDVRALNNTPLQTVRTVATTAFTAPGSNYYVYFAWPSSYEPSGNCVSVNAASGSSVGTYNCFNSGGSAASVSTTTDLRQRLMSSFVNGSGATVPYEIYRSHFVIAPSGTVYYQAQ